MQMHEYSHSSMMQHSKSIPITNAVLLIADNQHYLVLPDQGCNNTIRHLTEQDIDVIVRKGAAIPLDVANDRDEGKKLDISSPKDILLQEHSEDVSTGIPADWSKVETLSTWMARFPKVEPSVILPFI